MLEGYFGTAVSSVNTLERRQRVKAVETAVDIIKATVSTSGNNRDANYELQQALKYLEPLADAIQSALSK
ncbi:hypothetical protein HFD87_10080 [Pantoea sp. EKM21T]|uniref:hypothetical protein n=1 Tax=unclassified Pantoea TaxID=2630326 RepID=UPI00142D71F9|nr:MULTISPECIES: hypothetical protein [unclassified Pantoea]KAF6676813.1 hypothetical protein HFD87_10080 [Pantoea sp. EKM21T]KAF6685961.1 hypothetical protein HFD90_03685 [Pantoea sp. EKM22T]